MKRVFIVHGWDDNPSNHWIPWLKQQLESSGFIVEAPTMPNSGEPKIEPWVSRLNSVVGTPDENTYYVGHSVGCQTIMRHLEQQPTAAVVGGAVFVAPWFTLTNLSGSAEEAIAKPWIETSINFEVVKSHLPKLVALFSDNDPWVTLDNRTLFEKRLQVQTQILKGKKHIGVDSNMTVFPELLQAIVNVTKK